MPKYTITTFYLILIVGAPNQAYLLDYGHIFCTTLTKIEEKSIETTDFNKLVTREMN